VRQQTRLGTLLIAVLCVFALPAFAQPLRGRVEQRTFNDPTDGHLIRFNIYLPENYDTTTDRYPVVFHLHGIGGSQGGNQNTVVPRAFETALAAGTIGPVIVVFPNGYSDAFWADSVNSDKPAESDVLALISHVDATFRTIASPRARVMQGFSMGGFGATKFYSKFPDRFACCVEYDGALLTWQSMLVMHASLAQEIFNNNQAIYNQYSAWFWTVEHAPLLRAKPPLRMVVGSLVGGNRQFRDHLVATTIPLDYVETTCGHEVGCLLTAQGQQSAAFIASHLDLSCPTCATCDSIDFNNDGSLFDPTDVDAFLSVFSEGLCIPATATCNDVDFNNDTSLFDPRDIDAFLSVFSEGPCF
jgi:enterochelin esterase-like enzyme